MNHTQAEQWRPIKGYEAYYEVSSQGRIRSKDRRVWNGKTYYTRPGRMMRIQTKPAGYKFVNLYLNGIGKCTYIHDLLLTHFVEPRPSEKHVCRHLNDIPDDNRLENLRWGNESENMFDQSKNGRNHWKERDRCINGHEYTPENTKVIMAGKYNTAKVRICRQCAREKARATNSSRLEYKRQWRQARRAKGLKAT